MPVGERERVLSVWGGMLSAQWWGGLVDCGVCRKEVACRPILYPRVYFYHSRFFPFSVCERRAPCLQRIIARLTAVREPAGWLGLPGAPPRASASFIVAL